MPLIEQLRSISLDSWIQAAIIFLCLYVGLYIFRTYLIQHLESLSIKTATDFDDAIIEIIKSIHWPFYVLTPLYFASWSLELPNLLSQGLWILFLITISVYVISIATKTIMFLIRKSTNEKDQAIVQLLGSIIKLVLWVIVGLTILSNLGFNINSLLAGVGIGGIAIALAVQNVLSDLFSAFSIYFDKPFEVGDTIKIGEDMGTVEKVGIKSTRIRTLQGEQLIVSNQELTSARIQNFKRLNSRTVYYRIGITYDTPPTVVAKLPKMITDILSPLEDIEVNRVHFVELGDFALIYEIGFTVPSEDYVDYLNAQQKINTTLISEFAKANIEFAFPTQTIHLKK
jgi:small-conductance mechanosensitive channel